MCPEQANVILLAHGSSGDGASREATAHLANEVRRHLRFRDARIALLEESPSLPEAARDLSGPVIVFGLFAGDGMHGAEDAPRLVAALGRADAVFAGTITSLDGIADLVAAAVGRARV
jgi:sirohydrochlorin ferrochelatase